MLAACSKTNPARTDGARESPANQDASAVVSVSGESQQAPAQTAVERLEPVLRKRFEERLERMKTTRYESRVGWSLDVVLLTPTGLMTCPGPVAAEYEPDFRELRQASAPVRHELAQRLVPLLANAKPVTQRLGVKAEGLAMASQADCLRVLAIQLEQPRTPTLKPLLEACTTTLSQEERACQARSSSTEELERCVHREIGSTCTQ